MEKDKRRSKRSDQRAHQDEKRKYDKDGKRKKKEKSPEDFSTKAPALSLRIKRDECNARER